MRATHLLAGLSLALGAAAVIAARRRPAGLLVGAWRLDDGRLVIPAVKLTSKPATRWGSGEEEAAREGERPKESTRETLRDLEQRLGARAQRRLVAAFRRG